MSFFKIINNTLHARLLGVRSGLLLYMGMFLSVRERISIFCYKLSSN